MSGEQVDRAAGLFLDRAATTPPGQLRKATRRILEEVARLAVTLNYQDLHDALAGKVAAGVVHGAIGEIPVDAGSLRRMCCEAGILPVVLGGESRVLDEGQERRLVTGAIRRALELRDGGCIFPGCTVPADLCQAHHIIPWWDEGPTSLENLALVCRQPPCFGGT